MAQGKSGRASVIHVPFCNGRTLRIADGEDGGRHDLDACFVDRVPDVLGEVGARCPRLLRVIEGHDQGVCD